MPSQAMQNAPRGEKKPAPLKPNPGEFCLECRMGSSIYVPCGAPATHVVRQSDGNVLPMCAPDADHNVKNRGAKLLLEGDVRPESKLAPEIENEVEEAPPPSQAELAKVVELARKFYAKADEIEKAQEALKTMTEELTAIREIELPAAMIHVGIKDLGLANGWRVQLRKIIAGNVTKDHKAAAYDWLEKHGYADLIKRTITITFGRDESGWAKKFMADLAKRKKPLRAEAEMAIAPQTLQKFIRDKVEELATGAIAPEAAPPKDLFGIFEKTIAQLEDPAAKKPGSK